MSSEPAGRSSEVALSGAEMDQTVRAKNSSNVPTASSSWDVPHSQLLIVDIVKEERQVLRARIKQGWVESEG